MIVLDRLLTLKRKSAPDVEFSFHVKVLREANKNLEYILGLQSWGTFYLDNGLSSKRRISNNSAQGTINFILGC